MEALISIYEIFNSKVSLENKSAEVEYDRDVISSSALIEGVEEMGFEASLLDTEPTFLRSAFIVKDLKDAACVHRLESKLQNYPGVKSIKVSLQEKIARIIHDPDKTNVDDVCKHVSELGFASNLISVDDLNNSFVKINVEGMTCHSCVSNIEDFVGAKNGVSKIEVSLNDKEASIWYNPNFTNPDELRTVIDDMGFDASLQDTTEDKNVLRCSLFEIQSLGATEWTVDDEDSLFFTKGIVSIKSTSPCVIAVYYFQNLTDVGGIVGTVQSMGFLCSERLPDALDKSHRIVSAIDAQQKGSNEKGGFLFF